ESFGGQIRTKRSRGRLNRLTNVVDDAFDERRIVTLRHDPDQRLGAGFADDETALPFEFGFRGGDTLTDAVGFEWFGAPIKADVFEQLRQWFELTKDFARRLLRLDQRRENLEARDKSV